MKKEANIYMATRGRSSKNKGSEYERRIAKKMSEAFHTNVQRTAYSGSTRGIETQYNHSEVKGKNGFVGDLFFPQNHPLSIFNYELKNHAKVKLAQFFNSNGEIPSFLEQVTTDSRRLGGVGHSVPCLVIHVEREDDYVAFPFKGEAYKQLTLTGPTMITMLNYVEERTQKNYQYQMLITNLNNFFNIDLKHVYSWYKNYDWERLNHQPIKHSPVKVDRIVNKLFNGESENEITKATKH